MLSASAESVFMIVAFGLKKARSQVTRVLDITVTRISKNEGIAATTNSWASAEKRTLDASAGLYIVITVMPR